MEWVKAVPNPSLTLLKKHIRNAVHGSDGTRLPANIAVLGSQISLAV